MRYQNDVFQPEVKRIPAAMAARYMASVLGGSRLPRLSVTELEAIFPELTPHEVICGYAEGRLADARSWLSLAGR